MICGVHLEVFLSLAYALFLMGVAFLLERLGRRSHKRADRYRNSGFIYFSRARLLGVSHGPSTGATEH